MNRQFVKMYVPIQDFISMVVETTESPPETITATTVNHEQNLIELDLRLKLSPEYIVEKLNLNGRTHLHYLAVNHSKQEIILYISSPSESQS